MLCVDHYKATMLSGNPFLCPLPPWASSQTGAACQLWKYTSLQPDHGQFDTGVTVVGSVFSLDKNLTCDFGYLGVHLRYFSF